MDNQGYYPSFTSSDSSPGYGGMSSSSAGPYGMSTVGIPLTQPMDMAPELGVETGLDADHLFALGTMMDEGLFTFPLGFDGGFS